MTVREERFYRRYKKAMQELGFYPRSGCMNAWASDEDHHMFIVHYTWASALAGLRMMGIIQNVIEGMAFMGVTWEQLENPYSFIDGEMNVDRQAERHAKQNFLRFRRELA